MKHTESTLPPERSKPILVIKILLFSASIIPAITAGALARHDGFSNPLFWGLALLGLFLAQAGADYLYYYFTNYHTDGRDAHTKIFSGWRPLFVGSAVRNNQTIYVGFGCLLAALTIGLYFLTQTGPRILWLIAAGGLIAIFFTPLMLHGFKEPVIFLTFGPLCMLGVDFVLTGQFRFQPVLLSVPIGLLVTIVACLKGARYKVAEESGQEIIVNLNPHVAGILLLAVYLSLLISGFLPWLTPWLWLGGLTLPFSIALYRKLKTQRRISDYLWATVYALGVLIATSLFMAVGLWIAAAL